MTWPRDRRCLTRCRGHRPFASPAQAQRYLANLEAGRRYRNGWQRDISLRETGSVAGTVTRFAVDRRLRSAQIGFARGSTYWCRASEALRPLIGAAFAALSLVSPDADLDRRNRASRRLLSVWGSGRDSRCPSRAGRTTARRACTTRSAPTPGRSPSGPAAWSRLRLPRRPPGSRRGPVGCSWPFRPAPQACVPRSSCAICASTIRPCRH